MICNSITNDTGGEDVLWAAAASNGPRSLRQLAGSMDLSDSTCKVGLLQEPKVIDQALLLRHGLELLEEVRHRLGQPLSLEGSLGYVTEARD